MFSKIIKNVNETDGSLPSNNKINVNKKCSGNTASSCDGPNQAGGGCDIM